MSYKKDITVHVCDFCGKDYKSKSGAKSHERYCQCWHCRHVRHAEDPPSGVGPHVRKPGCRLKKWDADPERAQTGEFPRPWMPKNPPWAGECEKREPHYSQRQLAHCQEQEQWTEEQFAAAVKPASTNTMREER